MFDAVRNNKWVSQAILGLIAITFAFFGLESYVRNADSNQYVAKIGDVKISQQEFQQALREQQDRMRGQLGAAFDARVLETLEARKAILDDLINKRLLTLEAAKRRLVVDNEAIRQVILGIQAFQVDGQFSSARYEAALSGQNMTPAMFEAQLRQDLVVQQLINTLLRSSFTPNAVTDRILALQTEKRAISEVRLPLDDYLDKVKLADDAAKRYYDENSEQFRQPEQAIAEYVVLSLDNIGSQQTVSEDDIKTWYESHRAQYEQQEERRASHILIGSEKIGVDKARAKAEEALAEVRKNPGHFAELASKYSDDPGSAGKGGDLGFFGRGAMLKPFEDTAFSLKEGEISSVVQSDFGFHIIKLTGIHPAQTKPLSEVRGAIESELKKTAAARLFADAAETFKTVVYEQESSLAPVAEKFKLKIVRSDWIGRQPNRANSSAPLANEKLLAALFGEDSVKNRSNTEAIEIAPNTLAAARLVDYKAAAQQPFAGLQASIETLLRRQEAQTLAVKAGETQLDALKKGEDKQHWNAEKTITRLSAAAQQLPPAVVTAIFRVAADKLPAYTGVVLPGSGYALYRLNRVEAGAAVDPAERKAFQGQLENFTAQEEVREYLAALRERYKVEVNSGALELK